MQAVTRLLISIFVVLPVLSSADSSCIEQVVVIKNLTSLGANWNSFGRAKVKASWGLQFEEVFCPEDYPAENCAGLSFTTVDGNCGCGITFYFDDNEKVQRLILVYTVSDWSQALHAARDFVMSLKPLSAV